MGWFRKLLLALLVIHFGLILYTNRALFLSKFDETYWKDKYEHSQWKLPLSIRTLGDDGLYLYEGYRLIRGGDPTLLNAEVPPLGKYLIGASILVFGNGHVYGFLVTNAALVAFFLLAKTIFKNFFLALTITTLVALDPLITSQFTLSMFDSLQLLFASLTLLLINWGNPILAGVALGLFSETKIPVFTPIVFVLGSWVFWQKAKSFRPVVLFGAATVLAYLLPYTYYFLLGHNLFDWLVVQKWIINFYRQSGLVPNRGSLISALIAGRVQNLFTSEWQAIAEWSPLWPVIALAGLVGIVRSLTSPKVGIWRLTLPLAGLTLFAMVVYSLIPFWTRYLVMVLPFLYLGTFLTLSRLAQKRAFVILLTVFILINGISSWGILFPTPQASIKQFTYDWKNGFFADMYEQLTSDTTTMERQAFHRLGLQIFSQGEIESVAIDVIDPQWSRWQFPQYVKLRLTYFTRNLGPFSEEKVLTLVKEDGRWRIPWQWDLLISGLAQDSKLETTVILAKRGSILASDKTRLAEDFPSFLVWITPDKIDKSREDALLKLLENLFDHNVAAIAFHQRLVGNSLPDLPIPMGVFYKPLEEEVKQELLSYPGVSLTPNLGRRHRPSNIVTVGDVINTNYFECCSWLYSTTTYDGKEGIEKERNTELKGTNGGKLVIKDSQGQVVRTILDLPARDGKDVQL